MLEYLQQCLVLVVEPFEAKNVPLSKQTNLSDFKD